jgi:5-methylcytosine-specific restriction endonuclease McrA
MQRVLAVDRRQQPLMPCHPARARALLRKGKAAVFRRYPFIIILLERDSGQAQPLELKLDPGSQATGIALVALFKRGREVIWAGVLKHRGVAIKAGLNSRHIVRRCRRNRKCRYRSARFLNRKREKGWLPPSLQARVSNVKTWTQRLCRAAPVTEVALEVARFDTQALQDPEIHGIEYRRGTLFGYEVWEYLLEKWGRKCVYCDAENVSLEKDHVVPESKGGSNRVSNLTLSCHACNQTKGNRDLADFLAHDPKRLERIRKQLRTSLCDAAAMNATRHKLAATLEGLGLLLTQWTGGRTKFNREAQGYAKMHWLDAACVGNTGLQVIVPFGMMPLKIKATGRGKRQMCRMDKYGFPRTRAKARRTVHGFRTGDMVVASILNGRHTGRHVGRVAVRASGNFNIRTSRGMIQGITYRYCRLVHRADGYCYL